MWQHAMFVLHESLKTIPPETWGLIVAMCFFGLIGLAATETIED